MSYVRYEYDLGDEDGSYIHVMYNDLHNTTLYNTRLSINNKLF